MKYALYYHDSCPFCQRVLSVLPNINVPVEKRNVIKHAHFRDEQYAATNRTTVPCLLIEDGDQQQWMFESADIIRYLQTL
jgi:glutathione S-transferase